MKIIFNNSTSFKLLEPYEFNYDGYRSKFFTNILPSNPPEEIKLEPKKNYTDTSPSEEQLEIRKDVVKNAFPLEAFGENNILEVKFKSRFEDLVSTEKKKWIISLNDNLFLHAVCSIFLNMKKKGSALIYFNEVNYDLLNLLACNFSNLKLSKEYLIAENYNENFKKEAIKYLHFYFDSPFHVKLFLKPNNEKFKKIFEN